MNRKRVNSEDDEEVHEYTANRVVESWDISGSWELHEVRCMKYG